MPSRPPNEVLLHPDPLRLEAELSRRVGESHRAALAGGGIPRILILAATRRQALRIRRVLADAHGALLGVEVTTHLGLARALLEAEPGPTPRVLSRAVRETLVEELCAGRDDLALARYAIAHTGVPGALAGVFGELREAGVPADRLRAAADSDTVRDLAELYALYERALEHLAATATPCALDRAAFTRRAAAAAANVEPYHAVFQFGAYDLVGMNLELLAAVPCARPATWLVAADGAAPAWRFARAFLGRHVAGLTASLADDGAPRPFVNAARSFRDSAARPAPLPAGALRFVTAQGPEAELTAAARDILRRHAEGTPLERMAIVARSLEPYAAVAESVFARHGLPVDSSLRFALARDAKARTLLLLLRSMAGDFARADVIELARSPQLNHGGPPDDPHWTPDLWDRLSRRYRLVRGATEWTQELPEAVRAAEPPDRISDDEAALADFAREREAQAAGVARLASAVGEWARAAAAWRALGTSGEHARFLEELAARWIRGWNEPDAAAKARAGVLHELASLEAGGAAARHALGGGPATPLTADDVLAYLARAVNETELDASVAGGVSFLDAMQARGLVFEHVAFVGFNADLVPRRPREDPFLPDRVRRRLAAEGGFALPAKLDALEEESLLVASIVAAAEGSLTVSWQRADAEGKALPHSLQLSEFLRWLPGAPSLRTFLDTAPSQRANGLPVLSRVPTHPRDQAEWFAASSGSLTLEEAAQLAAASARDGAGAVRALLEAAAPEAAARLAPSLTLVHAVDALAGRLLAYDGVIGAHAITRPFSASSLERLGRCPQTYFFQDVLGVRPLDEAAEETRIDALELGTAVHRVLERTFLAVRARLAEQPEAQYAQIVAFARGVLDEQLRIVLGGAGRRLRAAYPGLWEVLESAWTEELRAYLEKELARLDALGATIESIEETWTGEAPLTPPGDSEIAPMALPLLGKVDRAIRTKDGLLLISDYKTGRSKLADWTGAKAMLRGEHVQLPVYLLLAAARGEGNAAAELLGLGPGYAPDRGFVREEEPPGLDGPKLGKHREGLDETLAVFAGVARGGAFPFRSDRHCRWCSFRPACRRHHHASRVRQEGAAEFARYRLTVMKSTKKPTLAAARRAEAAGEEDEA